MSGSPFAADAQSGWGFYEPMFLFSVLSPAHAIEAMLVLQPLTAGVGLYWFLRSERIPRLAACCGGLAVTLAITQSSLLAALPFAASLAFTTITLACCSRMLRTETWPRRLVWMLAAAVCWGQILAAHAGAGFIMGTITIIGFVGFRIVGMVSGKRWSAAFGCTLATMLLATLVGVNLLFLAPRVAYIGETSLGAGYWQLEALGRTLFGLREVPYQTGPAAGIGWPLVLATTPGAYLGGAVLVGAWLALSGSRRRLAWSFLTAGGVIYLLSLSAFADLIPQSLATTFVLNLYTHAPDWLGYELVLIIPILGSIGLASWASADDRSRWAAIGLSVAVFVGLPFLLGVQWHAVITVALGIAIVAALLWIGDRAPTVVIAIPLVIVLELGIAQVVSAAPTATSPLAALPVNISPRTVYPLTPPEILHPTPFSSVLTAPEAGRFILTDTRAARRTALPDGHVDSATEPAWFLNWALLTDARSVSAYRAVVLMRYWKFVRAMGSAPSNYEHIRFKRVPPTLADLLQVAFVLRPADHPAPGNETLLRRSRGFALYALPHPTPPISLFRGWRSARSPGAALAEVRAPGFNPRRTAIVERAPGQPASNQHVGSARYRTSGPGSATVTTVTQHRELLLIRTPYASGWTATLDGKHVRVLAADYVDQGVILPPGRHTLKLVFRDPWVERGMLATIAVAAAVLCAAMALAVRDRNRKTTQPTGQ